MHDSQMCRLVLSLSDSVKAGSHRPTRPDSTKLFRRVASASAAWSGPLLWTCSDCCRLDSHRPDATRQFCRVGSSGVKWVLERRRSRRRAVEIYGLLCNNNNSNNKNNFEIYFRTLPPNLCSHRRRERDFIFIPAHMYHATTLQLHAFARHSASWPDGPMTIRHYDFRFC